MPANIRIKDVIVELTPGGSDDGEYTAGTPVVVCVDSFSATVSNGLVETACGQANVSWKRQGMMDFSVTMTGKIPTNGSAAGQLLETIWDNVLVGAEFTFGGGVYVFIGIIESHSPIESGDAPTWSLTLAAYGTVPTQAPA